MNIYMLYAIHQLFGGYERKILCQLKYTAKIYKIMIGNLYEHFARATLL